MFISQHRCLLYSSFDIPTISVAVMAHKYCELNGTWFRHPESNQIWSNYTTCVNLQDLSVSYFLMVSPALAYKINWLSKVALPRSKMRYIREYCRDRVKEIATFEGVWKIWWLKPSDGAEERAGLIPLGNNTQVLTRESQLHPLSLAKRHRRSDTGSIPRYSAWRLTISRLVYSPES